MELSKRQTEKVGMAYVAERLYRDALRFAVPDIDDGIDFIVYDQAADRPFSSIPVQLKAFSGEEFLSDQKYLRIPGLFIVYLWNVGTDKPIQAFGMKYPDAERIVDDRRWSRSNGRYAITRGSAPLRDALKPYQIDDWRRSLFP